MRWQQFHIQTTADHLDTIEDICLAAGAVAVTLRDSGDEPVLEPKPGEVRVWPLTTVTALFNDDQPLQLRQGELTKLLAGVSVLQLDGEVLEDRAWEREWLKDFHPMPFGNRLWVCPTGMPSGANDAIELQLDPGLAFGTGTHPTTALCLEWLDHNPPTDQSVLDFGCGSGILAIAAGLLGARAITATDIDEQALAATKSNAEINGVAERITVVTPDALGSEPVDLMIANILAGTLVEECDRLARLTRTGGRLLLSGVLADQAQAVSDVFGAYFTMQPPRQLSDWVLLGGTRMPSSAVNY